MRPLPLEIKAMLDQCLQTEITTSDGEKMVLIHTVPFDPEEKAELEKLTYEELKMFLTSSMRNPEVYDVGPEV